MIPVIALVAVAVVFSRSHWTAQPQWTPDSLIYEAQARELTGTPVEVARKQLFFGPIGRSLSSRLQDQSWISYSAPFSRRRWAVPAMDAALKPAFGNRSLEIVSLIGYVLSGLFVYALARRRFSVSIALAAALFTLWFPPLRHWAGYPLTDTMGVASLALAMTAAIWALSGHWSRIVAWAACVSLVALTRDCAPILVAAALWLALAKRTRRTAALAASAVLTAAAVPLLFGAPVRKMLAFAFSGNNVPADDSWHFIASRYGYYVRWMIDSDFPFRTHLALTLLLVLLVALLALRPSPSTSLYTIRRGALAAVAVALAISAEPGTHVRFGAIPSPFPAGMLLIVALLPLFLPAKGDTFVTLARGGAVGAIAYLFLLPQWTALRVPLVVLPFAALGIARAVELAGAREEQAMVSTQPQTGSMDSRDRVPEAVQLTAATSK
jgi:hypothetical protein